MADNFDPIPLTIEVVSSFVSKNHMRPDDVPSFIGAVHAAVARLEEPAPAPEPEAAPAAEFTPASTARKSLANPDFIISMIDGKPYKTLKRHIGRHGLTPQDYRERYGLKADYPMVAPNYSEARRATAKTLGLGRKPKAAAPVEAAAPEQAQDDAKPKRGRKPKTL